MSDMRQNEEASGRKRKRETARQASPSEVEEPAEQQVITTCTSACLQGRKPSAWMNIYIYSWTSRMEIFQTLKTLWHTWHTMHTIALFSFAF